MTLLTPPVFLKPTIVFRFRADFLVGTIWLLQTFLFNISWPCWPILFFWKQPLSFVFEQIFWLVKYNVIHHTRETGKERKGWPELKAEQSSQMSLLSVLIKTDRSQCFIYRDRVHIPESFCCIWVINYKSCQMWRIYTKLCTCMYFV